MIVFAAATKALRYLAESQSKGSPKQLFLSATSSSFWAIFFPSLGPTFLSPFTPPFAAHTLRPHLAKR